MIKYVLRFIPLVLSTIVTFFSVFPSSLELLETDIDKQLNRINALEESYKNGDIAPVDETVFFNGDLEEELSGGLKFNELRYMATHNSYQTDSSDEIKKVFKNLSDLTFGLVERGSVEFISPTITEQLCNGTYSLELDVETFDRNGEISFTCMHSPYFEMGTSCYDFELALKEISMWSDNNSNHLPITIIIEFKESFLPLKDMKFPKLSYLKSFDETLRKGLGEKLFTPADMLGEYESFAQLRANDGWCKVEDMLGKVLILMHDIDLTDDYISEDDSLRTQSMFPMMRFEDKDNKNASFIIMNDPINEKDDFKEALKYNLIIRTRADKFGQITEERRRLAFESGAQIISTDYPVKNGLGDDDYYVSFGGTKTISPAK